MALSAGLAGTRRSSNLNNALSSGGFQAPGASKILDTAPSVSVSMVGTAAPIGPSASKRVLFILIYRHARSGRGPSVDVENLPHSQRRWGGFGGAGGNAEILRLLQVLNQ